MNDYSAYDIHRLDQAYPDALADIEDHIGNPVHKRRLAEVGPEVYAAELTRDLSASFDKPMSLAGWAAIATVRLMEAGKAWEEDTDAAWAKVAELTAELEKARAEVRSVTHQLTETVNELTQKRAQLTAANHHADGLAADVRDMQKANTAYANENARLRSKLADLEATRACYCDAPGCWSNPCKSSYRAERPEVSK